MRLPLSVVSLLATLTVAAAAQDEERASPIPDAAPSPSALGSFERMLPGEWRVTFKSGQSQFERWTWGPGRESIVAQTYGADAAGDPWRSLEVVYRDRARDEVRLLGLVQDVAELGRGEARGTLKFDGETLEGTYHLIQPGHPRRVRTMGVRWAFDGEDAYHETLLEATGDRGLAPLAEWDFVRSHDHSAIPPAPPRAALLPNGMGVFAPLLEAEWDGAGTKDGEPLRLRSTFEWIPHVEVVHARAVEWRDDAEPLLRFEAFVYRHPVTDAIRCLALSCDGFVLDGALTVEDGGSIRVESPTHVAHLDRAEDGTLQSRLWTSDAAGSVLRVDVRHHRVARGGKGR